MSEIERLINELCPNGVEYKTLGELGEFYGGLSGKTKKDFTGGNATFVTYMNVFSNLSLPLKLEQKVKIGLNEKQHVIKKGDVIFTGSSECMEECAISSVMCDERSEVCYLNSFCFGFRLHQEKLMLPDFSKYLFRSDSLRKQLVMTASGVTRFNVSKKKMAKIRIPIPPIEVQREIVRILDNFTEITSELTAELTAELDKRKKQYEYYRDTLLTFDDTVEWKTLGDIATIQRGGNFQKKDFCQIGVPCIHYGQIYTVYGLFANETHFFINQIAASKSKFASKNDIIMAVTSENVEDVCKSVAWLGNNDIAISGHTAIIRHNQNTKFLTYYFSTKMFFDNKKKLAHGTKVIEVTPSKLAGIKIPIPPLAEQQRIVDILDRFDSLCNDITKGLPAEIEARKKQYEYYRNKLLTFKEVQA